MLQEQGRQAGSVCVGEGVELLIHLVAGLKTNSEQLTYATTFLHLLLVGIRHEMPF